MTGKLSSSLAFLFIVFVNANFSVAQVKEGDKADEIVAIVGREIIMLSDLESRLLYAARQGLIDDPYSEENRDAMLHELIDEKLIVTKAIEDSLEVTQDEIDARWDYQLSMYRRQFGSDARIQNVFGMSITELKDRFSGEIRKNLLAEKLQQQKFGEVEVTQKDVEDFFLAYKDSVGTIPEQVEIYHIVRDVKIDSSAETRAYQKAKALRDSIIDGADFGDIARRHSEHEATASSGGRFDWTVRGRMFPEYLDAAFNLQEDEISLPVKTPLGYHIIETMKKRGDSILTRHVLIKVGQTTDDAERTKQFLLDLKERDESGESFEELAKRYSDDKNTKGFGGLLGKLPKSELPAVFRRAISDLEEGEISDPAPFGSDPNNPKFHIVYLKKIYPEHEPDPIEDKKQIEQLAKLEKRRKMMEEWLMELREDIYWEIKD